MNTTAAREIATTTPLADLRGLVAGQRVLVTTGTSKNGTLAHRAGRLVRVTTREIGNTGRRSLVALVRLADGTEVTDHRVRVLPEEAAAEIAEAKPTVVRIPVAALAIGATVATPEGPSVVVRTEHTRGKYGEALVSVWYGPRARRLVHRAPAGVLVTVVVR